MNEIYITPRIRAKRRFTVISFSPTEEGRVPTVEGKEARVWISGITAVKNKLGIKAIFDLSATPFFLRGSGYPEGTLFPWVASDFSLIDAIEAGTVPRR